MKSALFHTCIVTVCPFRHFLILVIGEIASIFASARDFAYSYPFLHGVVCRLSVCRSSVTFAFLLKPFRQIWIPFGRVTYGVWWRIMLDGGPWSRRGRWDFGRGEWVEPHSLLKFALAYLWFTREKHRSAISLLLNNFAIWSLVFF